MAVPTTFSELCDQLTNMADQGETIENLGMKFRKLQNKYNVEVFQLHAQIRKLEDKIQHLDGEKQGFEKSLTTVVKGVAQMAVRPPPRKALPGPSASGNSSGIKNACSFFQKGTCTRGNTCTFAHIKIDEE